MLPWTEIDRAESPGGPPLVLRQHGTDFDIRIGPHLLMSSRQHGSEEILAERVGTRLARRAAPRVLVGGLGMGYTLAAILRGVGPEARVTVAELFPAVVAWNRGPLGPLAGHPLNDGRVTVAEGDVLALLRGAEKAWDAVLLDVDNGPVGLTHAGNNRLYTGQGLATLLAALRPGGVLGLWSAEADSTFTRRLSRAGFLVRAESVRARRTKGSWHTIWVAARPA